MKNTEIIFGYHAAISAIKNPKRQIHKLLCTEIVLKRNLKYLQKFNSNIIKVLNREDLDKKLKTNIHQGIALYCNKIHTTYNLREIYNEKIIVILDSLSDSQNVGSIIRTSYLFGVKTILFNKKNSFQITPFLIKASSGAFEKVKIIEVTNLVRAISQLKKNGFWVMGLDNNANKSISGISRDLKKVFVLGSEGKGIRDLVKKNCDDLFKINIYNESIVDSLNVSNSAAVVLYEFSKK
ncbi:MAG: 23S rRNA (guanosine(2251)-2'-O)-methyltransferase RlmB [Rickettsiales bacterium]|nr:23S rRNA (guanosine(2251)-2'-O)-methyltransferase RlmB [Rickettsiales bacterium]